MKSILAIIPARSGSKTIPDKNIRILNGKPMISYSIEQALKSKYIERVIVSTDSEKYKKIAEYYGAEVPFLRPKEISEDNSLDIEVFQHALKWLQQNENYLPEICVHLRPTHPIREVSDIDTMIEILMQNKEADSIRSVCLAQQTPYKMWLFKENSQYLEPVAECDVKEAYNAPRQILPKVYIQNACIDIVRTDTILKKNSMTGDKILGYIIDYDFDIDTETDFIKAEQYLLLKSSIDEGRKLIICCDIDGILATKTEGNDYSKACPIDYNIKILNKLYDLGHKIILFTARGSATGINWEKITREQLKMWGLKYTELRFGKPAADIYIDDKSMPLEMLKNFL